MPGELRDLESLKLLDGIVVHFEFAAYWIRKRKGSANCREAKRSLGRDLGIRTTRLLGQFQKLVEAELVPDHDALFRPFTGRHIHQRAHESGDVVSVRKCRNVIPGPRDGGDFVFDVDGERQADLMGLYVRLRVVVQEEAVVNARPFQVGLAEFFISGKAVGYVRHVRRSTAQVIRSILYLERRGGTYSGGVKVPHSLAMNRWVGFAAAAALMRFIWALEAVSTLMDWAEMTVWISFASRISLSASGS